MKLPIRITLLLFSLVVLSVSAIGLSAQSDTTDDVVLEEDIERPDWQQFELTDVATGETFTLGDFYGKTVFVEPMATWCTNCRAQLRTVRDVIATFESEAVRDVEFVALSLETNLDDSRLLSYTENQGFDWPFAVMSEEMLVSLVEEFGRSVANAPSTPHFIIRPDGTFTELDTGFEDVEELVEQIVQAREDSAPTLEIEAEMTPEPEATEEASESAMLDIERRPWQLIELTDVNTGATFTLADFDGKTVFVEPMATWCGNCRSQLGAVADARASFGDDVVFLALSLETNLDPQSLASYSQNLGFDWTFAVMSDDLLVALVEDFGRSIASAPSTPHFIIRPDGTFTGVNTGFESASEIVAEITAESEA